MKKVINGRSYNTETAKELGYQTNGYANNDIYFTGETLYRKKTDERRCSKPAQFFLC